MSELKIQLKNVVLSFPHLFKPQKQRSGEGDPKYGASLLIDPETKTGKANLKKIEAAIEAAKKEKWGERVPKLKAERLCLRDGDEESYDGYEGLMYVRTSNSSRPTLVNRRGEPLYEDDGMFYGGCVVNAIVTVFGHEHSEGGKRVLASLEGVQFVKDGEPFGRKPLDPSEFDDLGEDEDDEDEAPKKSKKSKKRREYDEDDEDEDEAPKKSKKSKKRRDDDEDDDDDDDLPF